MKKVIAIVAIIVIAIVGLSSYNTNEVKKDNVTDNLIAELKTGGQGGSSVGNTNTTTIGGNKKIGD